MDPDSCACIPGKNSLALFICILTRPHLAQQPDPFFKKTKKKTIQLARGLRIQAYESEVEM